MPIGALLAGAGKVLGKGVGLLAKGGGSVIKTLIGKGKKSDVETTKAISLTAQQAAQAVKLIRASERKKISKTTGISAGQLADAARAAEKSGNEQGGFASRIKLAIVWEWLRSNWYIPFMGVLLVFGFVYFLGAHRRRPIRRFKRRRY